MVPPQNGKASLDRLKFSNFKLKTILNITRAINDNLPVEELLDTLKSILRDELNIGRALVYLYRKPDWFIIMSLGIKPEDCNINVERDLLHLREIDITLSMQDSVFKPFDFIIPVSQNDKPLAYILIGDFEDEMEGISPTIKHLHFIQTLTNIIIVAIENKRLIEENMQQERIKKEMEMAAQMQNMLVPKSDVFKGDKNVGVEAFYMPHFEVGGDYYDFDYLSHDEMFFCIADVSGKGMSAAILMSNFQAGLRALCSSEINLTDLVSRLNGIVMRNANGDKFITLFIARYNFKTHKLKYVNAGHNAPIFYNKKTHKSVYLKNGCVGLGMLDDIPILITGELDITDSSKILCFTDGVVELEKNGIADFGQKVVEKCIQTDKSVKETLEEIKSELDINKDNPSLFDDITLLGVDFKIN